MRQKSWLTNLSVLAFVVICVLGCSKMGSTANTSAPPNTNAAAPPAAVPADISGEYAVVGTNEDGSPYKGELAVIKRGDVYQFRWNAGKQYDGIGIPNGNVVAVSFTGGASGEGCGVVTYRVGSDGSLDGKWGMWGKNESGTEKAARTSGSDLAGDYNTAGTNPNGSTYKGKLKVASQAGGYSFVWNNSSGFGIRLGDFVSVGFGGPRCAFVAYEVKTDGGLDEIKKGSSLWIKTRGVQFRGFHWQDGYAGFSVGRSEVPRLKEYIANQKEHHRKMTFQEELVQYLEEYGMPYDERYLWS